jgi:site-specific recombinase XerD
MEKVKSSKIIDLAKSEVIGFIPMYQRLEQKVILGGLSNSTLLNYGRCIAKISLHFKRPAIELEEEQINGYLQFLLTGNQPSRSYFKHTVYGLRLLYRIHDLEDRIIKLPSLKRSNKLPVILSIKECKHLFSSGRILKHRVLLSLVYSAGLRSKELRNLKISDIDSDRMMIHVRQTKYNKDRYVPLSKLVLQGLRQYLLAYHPKVYLFNGQKIGSQLSAHGVQWTMKQSIKRSGITKPATIHTLRHSYATHLLEMGMDIDTLSKLLGHAHVTTTLIYLHVARLESSSKFSPFDIIYKP